ncbi:hypothetical protein COCON_G00122710 [Conger conger]|uniref:SOCS box domain-containing protein n=1 Tax=Conger conger TaxID=82655 RepID=A0A9Q1HZ44_CONCO|nr:hypothetical protein COCON_G00122710 [Conger conger]
MTEFENRPFALQLSNVYLTILALFCFKLFVKITLNLLTYFYIIKGNRKEAARISAEFYDFGQGQSRRGVFWSELCAPHSELCVLISQGYNVDVRTIDHVTPLHEACLGDHVACARALIDAGANVNATTIDGVTPLFNACLVGSATCTEILLENGANPQTAICQPSPIHEASSKGKSACVEALITWGADVDYDIPHLGTPLFIACTSKQLHCTRKLLDKGANVQKGRFLETPLHAAAAQDCTDVVKALLEYGADVNARNLELKRPVESAPPSSLAEGFLLLYEAMPRQLSQLCRLSIRDCLGQSRLHLIPQLQLPTRLMNFLQYR